jgi:hypothetical protein
MKSCQLFQVKVSKNCLVCAEDTILLWNPEVDGDVTHLRKCVAFKGVCEADSFGILSHPHMLHQRNILCCCVGSTWGTNHCGDDTDVSIGGSVKGTLPSLYSYGNYMKNQGTNQPSDNLGTKLSLTHSHTHIHTHTHARTRSLSLSLSFCVYDINLFVHLLFASKIMFCLVAA